MRHLQCLNATASILAKWLALFLLSAYIAGCGKSDRNQAEAATNSRLRLWAHYATTVWKLDGTIEDYKSSSEAFSAWTARGLIEKVDYKYLEKDYWNREYVWQKSTRGDLTIILIGSSGRDGVWQAGKGDDVYVEIRRSKTGDPQILLKPYK